MEDLTVADVNGDGIPDIIGAPLKVGTNTYRYFLRDTDTTNATGLFTTGVVTVTFRAGSFATLDGGQNVARSETFTLDPAQAGEAPSTRTYSVGPLSIQGPSIGIADIGFKDGMLILTIAIGVVSMIMLAGPGRIRTGWSIVVSKEVVSFACMKRRCSVVRTESRPEWWPGMSRYESRANESVFNSCGSGETMEEIPCGSVTESSTSWPHVVFCSCRHPYNVSHKLVTVHGVITNDRVSETPAPLARIVSILRDKPSKE